MKCSDDINNKKVECTGVSSFKGIILNNKIKGIKIVLNFASKISITRNSYTSNINNGDSIRINIVSDDYKFNLG